MNFVLILIHVIFINFTLPVLNSNYKIATDCQSPSLCYIASLLVAKMVCLPHSSFGSTLPVILYHLLFQIRNHWSGASGLCLLPLQNSMPCLRSVKVCIYYAQLNSNLTVFLIVFGLVLQQLLSFKMEFPSFCSLLFLFSSFQRREQKQRYPYFAILTVCLQTTGC